MDQFLYDYLLSGKAWLFVGSGPSIEMGYPTWEKLADVSIEAMKTEGLKADLTQLRTLVKKGKYPEVFSMVKKALGSQRLRQILNECLKPTKESLIYKIIAEWPIPVYLTTNYDNELSTHLAQLGLAYAPHSNSEDHMSLLVPDLSGAVVKLHGDLSEDQGLILTEEDYQQVKESREWEYWRSKMAAIFQMNRVIVIGYSLSDPNVANVLEASRKGTGVTQPIVWIAPNVSANRSNELLTQYRIRVVSYGNKDGQHKNLVRLLQSINEAVPPRTIIRIKEEVQRASRSAEPNAAAAGFFVFNEFCKMKDFDEKRADIILSAIQACLPELENLPKFSFELALEKSGWPIDVKIDAELRSKILAKARERQVIIPEGNEFRVGADATKNAIEGKAAFERMRVLFKKSLTLRIKREFPELVEGQVEMLCSDIESSLVQYFHDCGLSLASILFSKGQRRTLPGSIFTFFTSASTQYDDLTMRLAFFRTSIDCFLHAENPEINYLGRLSQGFFAFHAIGVFGEEGAERLKLAKETVWLIDSDTQIRLLALGCYGNSMFRECLNRLKNLGIRFFGTPSLLSETKVHLWFADNNVVKTSGQSSPNVIASANGDLPYRKPNLFMEGFINWQAAGNPCNWEQYLYTVFQKHAYSEIDFEKTINDLGIEVVDLESWPGFSGQDHVQIEEYASQIVRRLEAYLEPESDDETERESTSYRKAKPEAEVYNIIKKEREGNYHIISEIGKKHEGWFISHTSMLNLLEKNVVVTWQPEAFLSFASTMCQSTGAEQAKTAFSTIVLGLAQSGMQMLDDETIGRVFGGVIEQAKLDMEELRAEYTELLQSKYGESIESVLARVPVRYFPGAVTQIAAEIAQVEGERRRAAEARSSSKDVTIRQLEKKLKPLERYKAKLERKKSRKKKPGNKKK